MSNKKYFCPFIKQECVIDQCAIYDSRLNRCSIPVLTYNTYRLSESLNNLSENGFKGNSSAGIQNLPNANFSRM
jgi:hypothetical protein